jgi:AraC family transcriptional regulator, transcriptional activator of pobA
MEKKETIEDFYKNYSAKGNPITNINPAIQGQFNVFRRNNFFCKSYMPTYRRDFFKISLVIGKGILHYADKSIEINGKALSFSNPNIPYSWEATSAEQSGYFCLFKEEFIHSGLRSESLNESPLFKVGGTPIFFPEEPQIKAISDIFEKMLTEIESDYIYKYDLLKNYVNLIIHEAMKLQPATSYFKQSNASTRIVKLFLELLERQFPIDSSDHILQLKTAKDYSEKLSVHVNHLNRAVKEVTGKTTTDHIAERIINEAKALLKHTDWNISEIAYCLGFEYPAYFNNFFKKQTGLIPSSLRTTVV